MIFDHVENIEMYQGIHPGVYRGLELLRSQDFSNMEPGRYEVDGDNLFFLVQSYNSKTENCRLEAHRKYVDIQYVFRGYEQMGIVRLTDDVKELDGNPDKDVWHYESPVDFVKMGDGQFMVLWPQDVHMPAVAVDGKSVPCYKVVVKVKIA